MKESQDVHSSFEGSGPPPNDSHRSVSQADQVAYLADMILELTQLAKASRLATLAGILELAHAEARLQARLMEASAA